MKASLYITITLFILCFNALRISGQESSCDNKGNALPSVKISLGTIQGKSVWSGTGKRVDAYLGIPFAKPPVNELRFRPPVPYDSPFETQFIATQLPNSCTQETKTFFQEFNGEAQWIPNNVISEDCLYLNVWVPQLHTDRNRSVFFWIYGGGFEAGSSSLEIYDGSTLAAETNSIVVSSQYRLGALGFLYMRTEEAPGNQGLLDQNLALKWIHKNIHAFGGDPNEIIVMGESAGAASASYHLLSPMSRGLLKKAILMSGDATAPWAYRDPATAFKISIGIAEKANCSQQPDNLEAVVACLRMIPHAELASIRTVDSSHIWDSGLTPTMDEYFLPDTPLNLVKNDHMSPKDMLIGTTKDEGSYFLVYQYMKLFSPLQPTELSNEAMETLLDDFFRHFTPIQKKAIQFQYRNWDSLEDGALNVQRMSDAVGDSSFTCHLKRFGELMADQGSKVYYYNFNHRSLSDPWAEWMGAKHGYELEYFFGHPLNASNSFSPEERLLSKVIITAVENFVNTGIPSPSWKPYSRTNPVYTEFSTTQFSTASSTRFGPKARDCAFWNTFLPQLGIANVKNSFNGNGGVNTAQNNSI